MALSATRDNSPVTFMLCLKLSRIGKKNQPTFKLIVLEKTKDPWGDYLELLGNYNPKTKKGNFKAERIKFWLARGAQMTPAVNNLLINQKIIEGQKRKAIKVKKSKQAEKLKQQAAAEATKPEEKPQAEQKKPTEEKIETEKKALD